MNKQDLIKQLANDIYYGDDVSYESIVEALNQVYDKGFKAKQCKEDKDNPYHIDHKRQTKLDF